ncbi:MAG: CBS domain-containing protein [Gemmatimonadetes bacterium]|nr:CBS domain-containing protein [Gemmatimonadota bacterium]
MNVQTILDQKDTPNVVTIEPERALQDAVERLVEHNIGSLVVVDASGKPVGIITERDILKTCANGCEKLATTKVADAMTADLIVGETGDAIDYVMGIMTKNRIRHLPIVTEDGLCGMVSIGDVVKVQRQETEYENRHLREYIERGY